MLPREHAVTIAGEGPLRLAVIADTHSRPHPRTLEHIAAFAPTAIVHAGDIGDLEVLEALARVAPVHAVRGNIDVRAAELPDVLVIDARGPADVSLRVLLVHIGVAGPRIRADVARLARARAAELVICGHSHVPFIGRDRGLAVFNPGSAGPRRFALPIVFGTMVIDAHGAHLAHVDCETGARWAPM
ncbi:MAG TPA: metallophosphoesterase family protein [Nannocystaceae bacterium]|nr:metallophosphoesterase family protein [Nannocystaceae bacterium]